jgi:hypothetical protein
MPAPKEYPGPKLWDGKSFLERFEKEFVPSQKKSGKKQTMNEFEEKMLEKYEDYIIQLFEDFDKNGMLKRLVKIDQDYDSFEEKVYVWVSLNYFINKYDLSQKLNQSWVSNFNTLWDAKSPDAYKAKIEFSQLRCLTKLSQSQIERFQANSVKPGFLARISFENIGTAIWQDKTDGEKLITDILGLKILDAPKISELMHNYVRSHLSLDDQDFLVELWKSKAITEECLLGIFSYVREGLRPEKFDRDKFKFFNVIIPRLAYEGLSLNTANGILNKIFADPKKLPSESDPKNQSISIDGEDLDFVLL